MALSVALERKDRVRAVILGNTWAWPRTDAAAERFSAALGEGKTGEFLVDRAPDAYDLIKRSPYAAALQPLGHETVPNLGIARPEPATYSFYRIDWSAFDSLRARRLRMEDPSGAAR